MAILLTCLAFYHGGINLQQTRQALESVLKSDDPASEYDKWTDDEHFPDYLRDWHSINVDDGQQLNHVWNCVKYKVAVIDYYMPSLAHTNAEVITYLLQPRSRRCIIMEDDHKRLSEFSFLQMLKRHRLKILIDAGAQILEMSNLELARTWLKVDGRATVALFFDGDKPFIVSKQGTRTPLLASPYADNLSEVLVYLDEV